MGYVFGGRNGGFHDNVAKIIFANDTCSDISSTLSATRSHNSAFADSGMAGYCIGGTNSSWSVQATVDKFAFSDDSRTTLGTGLSNARRNLCGMANSGTAGYACGGSSFAQTYVDKFAFSNDARSTLGTGLSNDRGSAAAFGNSGVAGYVGGGYTGNSPAGPQSSVDKFAFSNDARSTLGTGLTAAVHQCAGMANNGVAGYVTGGSTSSGARVSTVDKFDFSNDSRSTLSPGLQETNTGHTACSSSDFS